MNIESATSCSASCCSEYYIRYNAATSGSSSSYNEYYIRYITAAHHPVLVSIRAHGVDGSRSRALPAAPARPMLWNSNGLRNDRGGRGAAAGSAAAAADQPQMFGMAWLPLPALVRNSICYPPHPPTHPPSPRVGCHGTAIEIRFRHSGIRAGQWYKCDSF